MNKPTDPFDDSLSHSLLDSAPDIAPAPARQQVMKDRLLARVAGDLSLPTGARTVRAQQGDWIRFDDHIDFKILHCDQASTVQTALWRLKPGAVFPSHDHQVDEECLVLEGELAFGEHPLFAGDFHFMKAGHVHPVGWSKSGCLLMIRADPVEPPGRVAGALLAVHNFVQRLRDR